MTKPDLSEFYRYSRPKKPPCRLGVALAQLDDSDSEKLTAALTADGVTTTGIQEWLSARSHDVSPSALTSHKRRTCTCYDRA